VTKTWPRKNMEAEKNGGKRGLAGGRNTDSAGVPILGRFRKVHPRERGLMKGPGGSDRPFLSNAG